MLLLCARCVLVKCSCFVCLSCCVLCVFRCLSSVGVLPIVFAVCVCRVVLVWVVCEVVLCDYCCSVCVHCLGVRVVSVVRALLLLLLW